MTQIKLLIKQQIARQGQEKSPVVIDNGIEITCDEQRLCRNTCCEFDKQQIFVLVDVLFFHSDRPKSTNSHHYCRHHSRDFQWWFRQVFVVILMLTCIFGAAA